VDWMFFARDLITATSVGLSFRNRRATASCVPNAQVGCISLHFLPHSPLRRTTWRLLFITDRLQGQMPCGVGYELGDRGSIPVRGRNFSLRHRFQTCPSAHPASYPFSTRGSYPGGKEAGSESDHSTPPSAEDRNAWKYTSTPPYVFMAWCLIKHRDDCTFTLYYLYVEWCLS
jgi:hypothetical protein